MKERLGAKGSVNALKGAFKMLGGNDGKLEVDELVARAGRGALALTSLGALFVGLGAALVAGRALRTMRRRRRGKRAMEAWRRCARAMQVARLLRARFPSSAAIATASTYPRAAVL